MKKKLKNLYKLALSIEKKLETSCLNSKDKEIFCSALFSCEYEKLEKLSERVQVGMNLKQFLCFVVPIERELNNKITDLEILIEKKDLKVCAEKKDLIIVLDNIRSPFNTGAVVRTCDVLGVRKLITTGYTPGYEDERVKKISMGAWSNVELLDLRCLDEVRIYLKEEKYQMISVETVVGARNIYEVKLESKTALVFGNERFGLSNKDLSLCNGVVKLPVFGVKNSLNINAALTACGYEWVRQNG